MRLDKKISVIIPTYNSSRYIQKAIKSVIRQTYLNWEIIIIDGGSSDNTLNLIKRFGLNKIKVFFYSKKKV
jgi:glycosyltransferase involved in cell wall biosynthesis